MTAKSTTQQITDQITQHIEEEVNRNKIFIVLLGILILGMAFFGKIVNDDANNAFEKEEQHFTLCNDYLSPIFDCYSCVTVDGVVKVAHKIRNQKQVLEDMKIRFAETKIKLKYYIENTSCNRQDLIEKLQVQTLNADKFWDKIIKNFESEDAIDFALDTIDSGELYDYTDNILHTVNALMDYHLETSKMENDKCQKSLKSFKRICIVSSSIGLTIIMAVILKFFSEKNEIQKRNIDNNSRKSLERRKKTLPRKKTISNKK
jgi:hypothetical protein